jgi:predicted DNA-binding ribbon-helix-helix protein
LNEAAARRAGVVKRSLTIAGHRTSISLEEAFWVALKALAGQRGRTVAALVAEVDSLRGTANLSSALRVAVLESLTRPPWSVSGTAGE